MQFRSEEILLSQYKLVGSVSRNNNDYLVYVNKNTGERLELKNELWEFMKQLREGYIRDISNKLTEMK